MAEPIDVPVSVTQKSCGRNTSGRATPAIASWRARYGASSSASPKKNRGRKG